MEHPIYRIHGLLIVSDHRLPYLPPASSPGSLPDVELTIGNFLPWANFTATIRREVLSTVATPAGQLVRSLERISSGSDAWYLLRFNLSLTLAFTEDGRALHMSGEIAEDHDYLASVLCGPAASFLRWQRGWPSLHASAAAVNGRVLAIGGPSGAGKSTTTAALALLGHPLFSDDVLGWRSTAEHLLACPGPTRVKLWPDTLTALGLDPESLPRVRTDLNKRLLQLPEAASDEELPLGAVYLLSTEMDAPPGTVRELHGAAAFTALKANCRDDSVLTPEMRVCQFESLAELARRVPVLQVKAHAGLDRLTEFAESLVADFRRRQAA
jgi:energy-coupling factor transporter ATP-binding protein EcfA2